MRWYWALSLCGCLMAANVGCYYDQWQAAERDNRVLREDLARVKQDLQDAELMLKQKDTVIESLNNQIAAKDAAIASLNSENATLRDQLAKAEELLAKYVGRVPEGPIVITQALPQPLHEKLKALAEKYPGQIEYLPEKGAVRWKADLLFNLGSADLNLAGESLQALEEFAQIVQSADASGFDVIVVGHTCTTPIRKAETLAKHPTNWHLSAHRAISVMELLGSKGVGMTRMGIMGYGEFRPIADNSTQDGKARNRRVEIFLVPKESVQTVGMNVFEIKDRAVAFWRAVVAETGRGS